MPRDRESVAAEDQVSPKLLEIQILAVTTTAVWYCPVEDKYTDLQGLDAEFPVVRSVQLAP
jgi:hypothetical protein